MRRIALWFLLGSAAMGQSGIPVLGSTNGASSNSCGAAVGYTNTGTITISAQGSLSGNLTNEISTFLGDSHLKTTGNGGLSQSSGTDVVFCTANDGTGTIIPYYLDPTSYVATTGAGEWTLLFPCINKSSTCKAYIYVGKASASDLSCGPSGTNNCKTTLYNNVLLDYGFGWTGGVLSLVDRTGNAGTGTNNGAGVNTDFIGNDLDGAYADTGFVLPALTNFGIMALFLNKPFPSGLGLFGIASNVNSGGTAGIYLMAFASGGICGGSGLECLTVGYANSSGSYCKAASTGYSVGGINTLHFVAGSHTGGVTGMTLFIDGAVDSGSVASCLGGSAPTDPGTDTDTFKIGRFGDFSSAFNMVGREDNLRVTKYAPTNDQMFWAYTNQFNPGPAGTYSVTFP
jgi:hypothetical protein